MCLSKLQKTTVCKWQLKKKKLRRFSNTIAQFTNVRSIHNGFLEVKIIDENKKLSLFRNWPFIPNFLIAHLSILE
jgi:hypothetical protein